MGFFLRKQPCNFADIFHLRCLLKCFKDRVLCIHKLYGDIFSKKNNGGPSDTF